MNLREIEHLIRTAFRDSTYPGSDQVFRRGVALSDPDAQVAVSIFGGKKWKEVKCYDIINNSFATWWLSPCGCAYFCPAIILCSIHDTKNGNIFIWHNRVLFNSYYTWEINSDGGVENDRYNSEFRSLLNSEQANSVSIYVKFLAKQNQEDQFYSIQKAQQSYDNIWRHFEVTPNNISE